MFIDWEKFALVVPEYVRVNPCALALPRIPLLDDGRAILKAEKRMPYGRIPVSDSNQWRAAKTISLRSELLTAWFCCRDGRDHPVPRDAIGRPLEEERKELKTAAFSPVVKPSAEIPYERRSRTPCRLAESVAYRRYGRNRAWLRLPVWTCLALALPIKLVWIPYLIIITGLQS